MNKANELIKYFERCRLTAYRDSGSVLTIGWGRTSHVHEGDIILQDQADNFLAIDLLQAEKRVDKVVLIALQDYEKAALISQAYNLRSFEMLANHLQLSGRRKYKEKMLLYTKDSQGHELNGLLIRRICERLLFENKYWLDIAKMLQNPTQKSLEYTKSFIPKLFL